jgi:hypothetical protein
MGYVKVENLIATLNPEQAIFVQSFYNKFDIDANTPHKKILNVEPIFYQGPILGSEFLTYSLNKLYMCLNNEIDTHEVDDTTEPAIDLMDENNVLSFTMMNLAIAINALAVITNHANNIVIQNCYFSHIAQHSITAPIINMKFIGYRITLT